MSGFTDFMCACIWLRECIGNYILVRQTSPTDTPIWSAQSVSLSLAMCKLVYVNYLVSTGRKYCKIRIQKYWHQNQDSMFGIETLQFVWCLSLRANILLRFNNQNIDQYCAYLWNSIVLLMEHSHNWRKWSEEKR